MENDFTQIAGFIGKDKDRFSMTFGGEPRHLTIVGKLEGDGSLPAPDADVSVAIRKGTSKEDAIALLIYAISEVHGLPKTSDEALGLANHVLASLNEGLTRLAGPHASRDGNNVVPLRPQ